MRLNINLATQKYEDARAFYMRWGSAMGFSVALMIALSWLAWSSHRSSIAAGRRVAALQAKIAALDGERKGIEDVLNRPENRDVRDQSHYWNSRIAEKSFSWTRLFSDLEKIMPGRVYVTGVQPQLDSAKTNPLTDSGVRLKIIFNSEKHDDAVELVKKMERSAIFHSVSIGAEGYHPGDKVAPAHYEFDIDVEYTPARSSQNAPVDHAGKKDMKEGI